MISKTNAGEKGRQRWSVLEENSCTSDTAPTLFFPENPDPHVPQQHGFVRKNCVSPFLEKTHCLGSGLQKPREDLEFTWCRHKQASPPCLKQLAPAPHTPALCLTVVETEIGTVCPSEASWRWRSLLPGRLAEGSFLRWLWTQEPVTHQELRYVSP